MQKYLLIILALVSIAWASDSGWDGGSIYNRTVRFATERLTASDTINSGESGKYFSIHCPDGGCEFELPTAKPGMIFTFVSELKKTFNIDPASTDTIRWWSTPQLDAGDKLVANGATYNSITIFSTQSNYWNVKDVNGTFNDGGA